MRTTVAVGVLIGLMVFNAAGAQTAHAAKPPNPCRQAAYRAFDFWVGHWRVESDDGQLLGHNRITREEGGCLLLERWQGAKGSTGQSYNYYDPQAAHWRQVWVSQGSIIDYAGGLTDAGAMRLEGEIVYHAGGRFEFRGTWTPLEDGRVRQHFEQYDPDAKQWNDWFVGIYHRTKDIK